MIQLYDRARRRLLIDCLVNCVVLFLWSALAYWQVSAQYNGVIDGSRILCPDDALCVLKYSQRRYCRSLAPIL